MAFSLLLLSAPSWARDGSPSTLQVRPGTVIEACGGLVGGCEARLLSGTVTFQTEPPELLASRLEVSSLAGGGSMPFPSAGDLQLHELDVRGSGSGLLLESPPGSRQTASLELVPFGGLAGEPDGYFLAGTYDEGCCDRFVLDLGVVPLLPVGEDGFLDLRNARFRVKASFRDLEGGSATATPVPLDSGSGWFWFFQPQNPELFVKILDACAPFGRYWIFVAGLTDLAVDVEVFDRDADYALVYQNPAGRPFETVVDTRGYPCEGTIESP